MIKLINIITQIIIVLGCCAILIFTLSIAIAFAKNDFTTITNIMVIRFFKRLTCKHSYVITSEICIYLLTVRSNIMKTRKHFIRKYELLARCIQTNLELFILQ